VLQFLATIFVNYFGDTLATHLPGNAKHGNDFTFYSKWDLNRQNQKPH